MHQVRWSGVRGSDPYGVACPRRLPSLHATDLQRCRVLQGRCTQLLVWRLSILLRRIAKVLPMKPTIETKSAYHRAVGLAFCARTYVALGMWESASRAMDRAREAWVKVEWEVPNVRP